jgi:hypothetical protein
VLVVKALSYHTQRLMKEKKFDKEIQEKEKVSYKNHVAVITIIYFKCPF